MNALLVVLVVSAVDGGTTLDAGAAGVADAGVDTALAEIRQMATDVEPTLKAPWVKAWVRKAHELKHAPPFPPYYCSSTQCQTTAFDGGKLREVNDEMYYARVADPIGYARPFELLAKYGVSIGKGTRVVDYGYGSVGQLQMLEGIGAEVTGIEVAPLLPIIYANIQTPKMRTLHGYFPSDAELVKKVGTGIDVFMSKNTLKRGYVHPDADTGEKPQIELGMSDEAALKIIYDLLKPGGVFYIYNFSPPVTKPFHGMMDGRSAFTREQFEKAGFEVLTFDEVDTKEGRATAKVLHWGTEYENTIDAHATLVRRPLKAKKASK